jgi:carboxyl-terminal processing protease
VCLTPPAALPIPHPNFSLNAMKLPFSPNVWFSMLPALNMASFSPITLGDQAGTLHPTFMGQSRHTIGNFRVLINFLPGTTLLCSRIGNNFNCVLGIQVLPSMTNVFLTYKAGEARPAGAAMPADLERLLASLDPCGSTSPVESALLGPGVGYLRIRRFSLDVPSRFYTAMSALQAEGVETLIVDVRGNPGGELTAFLELAGDFLSRAASSPGRSTRTATKWCTGRATRIRIACRYGSWWTARRPRRRSCSPAACNGTVAPSSPARRRTAKALH